MSTEFVDKYGNMLRNLSADEIETLLGEDARTIPYDQCGALIKDLLIAMVLLSQDPEPGISRIDAAVRVLATFCRQDTQRKHLLALAQAWMLRGCAEQQGGDVVHTLDRQIVALRESLERGNIGTRLSRD